jgi:predicted nuclease with RNAse H fold
MQSDLATSVTSYPECPGEEGVTRLTDDTLRSVTLGLRWLLQSCRGSTRRDWVARTRRRARRRELRSTAPANGCTRAGTRSSLSRVTLQGVKGLRVIAIDWSGRSGRDQRRFLWLAETIDGELVRLENGRTRAELVEALIVEKDRDPRLIVGLDFAFSLPAWYVRDRGLTARTLWAALAEEALTPGMRQVGLARWMNTPEPPFWTTGEAHRRLGPEQKFRRTEDEVRAPGFQPKSVFQLVGAGQVGPGSLYGMQALHRLAASGFRIWPFDAPGLPLVVEIFPRLLTGAVTKSSQRDRERYLAVLAMPSEFRRIAAASEDAFDAAVSALVMAVSVDELVGLHHEPDYALEGRIWQPITPVDLPGAEPEPSTSEGEIMTVVARVIGEAAARGDSAEAQAEQVLGELNRRGLLRLAPEAIRYSSTTGETDAQVIPS